MHPSPAPHRSPRTSGRLGLRLGGSLFVAALATTCLLPAYAAAEDGRSGLAQLAEQTAQGTGDTTTPLQSRAERKAARQAERQAERRAERRVERQAAPGQRGAAPVKAGWWWLLNQPPEEAETGLAAIPAPPTPTIPAGTLPVGALLGEAEKVSALEIRLEEPDRAVESLVLGLQESQAPLATVPGTGPAILACQVTESFWADGQAARWPARPAYDCEQGAVEGTRDDDGRWSFDLTPLAKNWTGPDAANPSVVLVEAVEAPGTFQVTFEGITSESLGLTATFGESLTDDEEDQETDPGTTDDGGGSTSAGGGGSVSSGGSSGDLGGGSGTDLGSPDSGSDPVAGAGGGEAAENGTVDDAVQTRAVAFPSWYDGIPVGGMLILPIALLLAFLAMLALGPDGQPVPGRPQRGVSLALERLRGTRASRDQA